MIACYFPIYPALFLTWSSPITLSSTGDNEVSKKSIKTGAIVAYQSSGNFLKWHPHWHSLILEGGFDEKGNFVYLPIPDTGKMTELFRKLIIKYFQEKELINEKFARNLLSWTNSGFSIDNSVRIFGSDDKAKEALAQYIARGPVSLKNIKYEPFHGKVLYKIPKYHDYFKENFKYFDVLDFIAEATQHIPPKHKQYIRRYGLYSSRTRGIWDQMNFCLRLAPQGWKEKYDNVDSEADAVIEEKHECSANIKKQKSAWARLISKVYGVDPLTCPKCNSEMKILAVIMDPDEIEKIIKHLVKIGRPPPYIDSASLN